MSRKRSVASSDQKSNVDEVSSLVGFRGGIIPELNEGLQRVGHTIVVYKHDMYLYGGYGPKNTYANGIFCNVKMTLQWKELRGVGVIPTGRANHTAIMHENKMIIFGGQRNLDVFDDLYIVNLDTMRWERVHYERAQGPGPVFSHVAVYVPPTQSMIVIGGFHQRQHNMYIAHSFDIRHRVWNGIRGPESVNPSHLQLCCAAYHSASSSLVVIGIVEKEVLTTVTGDLPTVFMMNVHSGAWVEINTPAAPESPIPFRINGIWDYFIRDAITMGGVYDDRQQEWYFPILVAPIENHLTRRKSERTGSLSTMDSKARIKHKTTTYGFLVLQLDDMTWSLVPIKFPKQVLSELMQRKGSKNTFGQDHHTVVGKQKNKTTNVNKISQPLFSVSGVSRFQHKYAFAAIDSSGVRRQRSSHKLLVMHGGMSTEDYIMLSFTPILKKRGTTSTSTTTSFAAFTEGESFAFSSFTRIGGSGDFSTNSLWEDDHSVSEVDFGRLVRGEGNRKRAVAEPVDDEIDENIMVGHLHRIDSDSTILPIFPTTRSITNAHRFAVLYHPRSAVHSDKLLPDPTCPVAVLDKESDVKQWAENYYAETREWIATSLETAREEELASRKNHSRRRRSNKSNADDDDLDSSDTLSDSSGESMETKGTFGSSSTKPLVPIAPSKPKDFFLDKNLEIFSFGGLEVRRLSSHGKSPFLFSGETVDSIGRLRISVKRNREVQRLPSMVFQRASLGNITDIGGATAFILMEAALQRVGDGSDELRRRRALIRWRYLRVMVLNGEAAFIMHRARQDEARERGMDVSSTSQLVLAPDLHIKGPMHKRVTTRPIPYAVPTLPAHVVRSSDVTQNGLVMYHCLKNVK
ncbi:uncharacterized protein TM35_000023650 [Trypanosoma theileri]|uniref:Uncharacterized protein n=1 Tax=Trypanosoma theileri TaxID=67003 RepID=A0A1X0P8X6_9TRYP|nr:uncharacterized protein TM35_000023650 [Trypanosoma theileri]ORC93039.1 hypothetical protein TM35_000023650 [Trypanosoma theileri]